MACYSSGCSVQGCRIPAGAVCRGYSAADACVSAQHNKSVETRVTVARVGASRTEGNRPPITLPPPFPVPTQCVACQTHPPSNKPVTPSSSKPYPANPKTTPSDSNTLGTHLVRNARLAVPSIRPEDGRPPPGAGEHGQRHGPRARPRRRRCARHHAVALPGPGVGPPARQQRVAGAQRAHQRQLGAEVVAAAL